MMWATRAGVHIDRAACAWLIQRFVDEDARFTFVTDPDDVPVDATPFDMRGVELGHQGDDCSFETILRAMSTSHPDDVVLDLTRPIFDAVYSHLRRSVLTGTDPA